LAVLAALLGTVLFPMPALAHHAYEPWGHWVSYGPGTSQPPIYDRNVTIRNNTSLTTVAGIKWRDAANWSIHPWFASYGQGDGWNCNPENWSIVICGANNVYTNGVEVPANATTWRFNGGAFNGHIHQCVIRLSWSQLAGATDGYLQAVITHEVGHCLGLRPSQHERIGDVGPVAHQL
jgi:hypothetical protein